jgi:hypothetical protein
MSGMKRKKAEADYSSRIKERRKMTNYLRTGGFRKIVGTPVYGRNVRRWRLYLASVALAVFLTGMYFVIF